MREFPGGPVVKIRLPVQGTWVQSLIPEDPTCLGALSPCPQLLSPSTLEPVLHSKRRRRKGSLRAATKDSPRSPQPEKSPQSDGDPAQPKVSK